MVRLGSKLIFSNFLFSIAIVQLMGISVVHRADYQKVLLAEAKRLGAIIHLNAEVISVDVLATSILLASHEIIYADVIIGADGEFLSIIYSWLPIFLLQKGCIRSLAPQFLMAVLGLLKLEISHIARSFQKRQSKLWEITFLGWMLSIPGLGQANMPFSIL